MTRLNRRPYVALGALMLCAMHATAQQANGQTTAQSFGELQSTVVVGEAVAVRDDTGRVVKGKVVSLQGDQLVIARPRSWFRAAEERTFTQQTVSTIERVDSTWNGALIGVAVGIGAAGALTAACINNDSCATNADSAAYVFVPTAIGFGFGGMGIGAALDSLVRRTIFQRQPPAARITMLPVFDTERFGLATSIRF